MFKELFLFIVVELKKDSLNYNQNKVNIELTGMEKRRQQRISNFQKHAQVILDDDSVNVERSTFFADSDKIEGVWKLIQMDTMNDFE